MAFELLMKGFQIIFGKYKDQAINQQAFGEKIGIPAKLFGCWHQKMTRPFFEGKTVYRACLKCGARKPYNPETLQSYGKFYYPLVIRKTED